MFFQNLAQRIGRARAGFAVALGDFGFHRRQHGQHRLGGLIAQGLALRRVQFGLGGFGLLLNVYIRGRFLHFTAQGAQLIGPHQHLGQGGAGIGLGGLRLRQSGCKSVPHALQLVARGLQLGRELHIYTGPSRLRGQGVGLLLPLGYIGLQSQMDGLRFFPAFGGQHLNTLGQQDRRFALHHHLVLQIVHGFHDFGQLHFQTGQRFP